MKYIKPVTVVFFSSSLDAIDLDFFQFLCNDGRGGGMGYVCV